MKKRRESCSRKATPVLTSVIDGNLSLKSKRSQAAMEFLMTYGWAILAAIIVIAVIALYFRPGTLVQNQCILGAPFNCYAGVVDATGGVQIEIANNGGEDVTITGFAVEGCVPQTAVSPALPDSLDANGKKVYTLDCDLSSQIGERFDGEIDVSYTRPNSNLPLTISGKIVDEV